MWNQLTKVLIASFVIVNGSSAYADVLQGRVEESTSAAPLQAQTPKLDLKPLNENCICINPHKIKAAVVQRQWHLVDDGNSVLSIGNSEAAAQAAVEMIKFYNITDVCSVGKSDGTDPHQMVYFKSRDAAPVGAMPHEDTIGFDTTTIKAEERNGSWKVTANPDLWLLDFAQDKGAAERAADIIHYYGFTNQCFVGNPARAMQYWRK